MRRALACATMLLVTACATERRDDVPTPTPSPRRQPSPTQSAKQPTATPAASATAAPISPAEVGPPFSGTISELSAARRKSMTPSAWREGCPVGLDDRRLLSMTHRDAKGGIARGELVVHRDVAEAVLGAFRRVYAAGFPITKMRTIEHYDGDDQRSMNDDNTSAFNCRNVKDTTRWSEHSYGRAVDINPFENPWVSGSSVDPPEAAAWADRSRDDPRMIRRGDSVWQAFSSIAWEWGGDWRSSKDYQHFSASGR